MASSSTSSVNRSCFKYDVFLSFRGEDTRNTFVGHLYHALQQKSIQTYKDDERIKKGKMISDELVKSIQESRFHIIVFSKNYASSSWCLEELVKIMECQKKKMADQTAYPVFYDVEPSQVRKQSGEFGQVFAKHEKEEAVGKWRETLEEAAGLAGWELKNTVDGNEAKFIQKIVEEISLELRFNDYSVDENLVGMEARIRDVVSSLEIGINDVRMIGIKGMGGGGKTTLAKAVFDHISFQFEGTSFVENVRENSNPNFSGLKKLQKQVLKDVLNDRGIKISNVHDGKKMLKKMLCCRKVLVVLDDVDHIDQLKALAGELNWFNEGSRIIITTRDQQVLVAHRVNLIRDVNLLSHGEAICLFSRYAFGRESPIQGYEELSGQVVGYAAGLPLTITVLGSFLCGKNELEWEDAIERLKTIPLKDTLEKLELSYIGLEEDYKEIFLDVACILEGWEKEEAITALESCGFHARNGLRVLEQKSLVTISTYGHLEMHDHIEEMGKNIVRRLHPNEPNRHSRLWIDEEVEDILANNQGTEATTCMQIDMSEFKSKDVMKGLGNMKNLRFLKMHSWHDEDFNCRFDEVSQYFPNALRYLRWENFPFSSLRKTFQANNLVALDMFEGEIVQLWEGGERKVLKKLKFLNLGYSNMKSFDLGLTPNLEKLNLGGCVDLVELHIPEECLRLKSLDLGSSKLRALDLRGAPNLEYVNLRGCVDLVELHIPEECLRLKSLDLGLSKLRALDLRGAPNLEYVNLRGCNDLVELHIPEECLRLKSLYLGSSKLRALDLRGAPNLEYVNLGGCLDLVELHIPECLKLKLLNLDYSKLSTIDLRRTPNLDTLSLKGCNDLVQFDIPIECINLTSLEVGSYKLTTIAFRWTPNLKTLRLGGCYNLVELQIIVECHLKSGSLYVNHPTLRTLGFHGILNLESFGGYTAQYFGLKDSHIPVGYHLKLISPDHNHSKLMTIDLQEPPNLEKLFIVECVDHLVEIHPPVECRLKITSLNLNHSKLRTLDLQGTPNLETLSLVECVDLVELRIPIECRLKLISLEPGSSKLRLLDLRGASNLEKVHLGECVDLVELHIPDECLRLKSLDLGSSKLRALDLRRAPNLEYVNLGECVDLVELHIRDECLRLKSFDLGSSKLRALDLRGASNLETLSVRGCYDLTELHIHSECPKLESINIMGAKLRTFDLGLTPNLKTLSFTECYHLVKIHAHDGCLKKVNYIKLSDCLRFKFLFIRKSLEAGSLSKLHLIAESLDIWPMIPDNNMREFGFTCLYEEHGISLIGNLEKLISLGLSACTNLESFSQSICGLQCLTKLTLEGSIPEAPKDLDQLECLEELHLLSTKITHLPDSICMLKHLKCLKLHRCWLLEKLPEDLSRLERLEELTVSECIVLRDIPNSICEMKHLECFHLTCCVSVEKLPEQLGRLKCLKELNIEGTNIRHLPQSIFELKGLRIVAFKWLLKSYGFTSTIQTLEGETFSYVEL